MEQPIVSVPNLLLLILSAHLIDAIRSAAKGAQEPLRRNYPIVPLYVAPDSCFHNALETPATHRRHKDAKADKQRMVSTAFSANWFQPILFQLRFEVVE